MLAMMHCGKCLDDCGWLPTTFSILVMFLDVAARELRTGRKEWQESTEK